MATHCSGRTQSLSRRQWLSVISMETSSFITLYHKVMNRGWVLNLINAWREWSLVDGRSLGTCVIKKTKDGYDPLNVIYLMIQIFLG